MRIFLVIPTLHQGGAERVMSELANTFITYPDIKVHLILLAKSSVFYTIHNEVIIHQLGFENKGRIKKVFAELRTFSKLRKLFKNLKPDTALSFMEKYNSFTILASLFTGTKVFVSDRSNPLKKQSLFIEILRKSTYKYAAGIIAQTELAKKVLQKKVKNKNIRVIPNPIKKVSLYPDIDRKKIIINVGRLVPEKGQRYLLEAYSKIMYIGWELIILGDGPLRKELEDQAKLLGITKNLYMPGAVNNVDEWLAKSSIFAFPSVSEGFPNALAEAMSAGLPCVSFDCEAGPRDIISDGENGFLVPLRDVDEFSNKINTLINNPHLRVLMGSHARTVREDFERSKVASEYLKFFLSLK